MKTAIKTIVRCPRGTGRKVVPIEEVEIPDLWHIATFFSNAENAWEEQAKVQKECHLDEVDPYITLRIRGDDCKVMRDMILKCWHLCLDLKANIINPNL
jgi:hypothetical protein